MSEPRCHEPANALLPWYLSGGLSRDEENRVRDHVEGCDACSAELDELRGSAPPRPPFEPLARPAPQRLSVAAGRPALAYALPAVLLIPALLGLYWLYLGLPSAPSPAPHAIRQSASLDLGDGGAGAADEIPSLAIPPGAETVVLSFSALPAVERGRAAIALEGPGGVTLARQDIEAGPDPEGRFAYAVEAALLRAPGRYRIVLAPAGAPGNPDERDFPFEVVASDPVR